MRITVIGAGYVGLASALAAAHIGHDVRVLEKDSRRTRLLAAGIDPLNEPLFSDLLGSTRATFTTDPRAACRDAEAIVIAVGTPHLPDGGTDLSNLHAAAATVAAHAPDSTVLVRSTVPVGTGDLLQEQQLADAEVVSNPEFLREGTAVNDALRPDRIVAGGSDRARAVVEEMYGPIIRQDYPALGELPRRIGSPPLCWMDRRSAELTKYAANAFLATKLSFVNEIANIAAAVGADIRAVTHAIGLDPRIAPAFLRPGIGWGGSCFPKDARALSALAEREGYDFALLKAVIEQNNRQLLRFYSMIEDEFRGRARVRIGLLGLAFKGRTSDCRESPAIALARLMVWRGWEVVAFDPGVTSSAPEVPDGVVVADSLLSAALGADALVVATDWPEFATADFHAVRNAMQGDVIFDGRCIVEPSRCAAAGLRYVGIGAASRRQRISSQAATRAGSRE